MLAKEKKGFINLGKIPPKGETVAMTEAPVKPYYPSFYIDKNIGLVDSDLEQEITAVVKIVPKRISKTITNGQETYSCEVDVVGIKIGG